MDSAVQTPASDGARAAIAARAISLAPMRADCAMELTGVLLHAEVAMKPLGDGTFVPAIVLELDDVGAGHHRVVAHIPYPRGDREKAEARLKTLRPGEPVTVTTHLVDVRLMLPAASLATEEP